MARKIVTLFVLAAFSLFNFSCFSLRTRRTATKNASEIDRHDTEIEIIVIVTKAGKTVKFQEGYPGKIVPSEDSVFGTTLQFFEIDKKDLKRLLADKKGNVVEIETVDGLTYRTVSYSEGAESISFSAYVPTTIPFSDIQQVWIRKRGLGTAFLNPVFIITVFCGIVLIAGAVTWAENWTLTESCPFIYSWNGEEYVLDAEPYGAAVTEGLKRTDWVELSSLREVDGKYRILLTNELDETQYTDELKLVAVDHTPGVRIAPDLTGRVHTFSRPLPPVSAVDQNGRHILTFVRENDKVFWLSDLENKDPDGDAEFRDELVFEFPKPAGAKKAKLLANVWTTQWGSLSAGKFLELCGSSLPSQYEEVDRHGPMYGRFLSWMANEELYMLKVRVETPGGWKTRGMIMGGAPVIAKDKACVLDVGDVPGEILRIKVLPPVNFWMVNSLAVDYGEDSPIHVTELAADRAVDHTGRDARPALASTDGSYLESPNAGERTELVFTAPPLEEGLERTVLVKASGYYRIHVDARGEPRTELIERVLGEPGFAARYSFGAYLKWVEGLRAGQAPAKRRR